MSFKFSTFGNQIRVERGESKLTPFGGLVAFSSFIKRLGIIEELEANCPINRTSNNATPVRDILLGFILTCVQEGTRFKHVRSVQNDPVLGKIFGVKRRIPGDDTIRRFFGEITSEAGKEWIHKSSGWFYNALGDYYILDWDATVTTRYGKQEEVAVGYNPHKPGRGSHHPLISSISGTRLCLSLDFRSGDSHASNGWLETMEDLFSHLPVDKKPYINRADIGFCGEKFLFWHESVVERRPNYLFKLKKTSRVKEALMKVRQDQWDGAQSFGALQVASCGLELTGWSRSRRVVLTRRLIRKESPLESGTFFGECEYRYSAYVTNLNEIQFNDWQIVDLYNKRADCENIYDELKNQWGLGGFCSKHSNVTEFAARMTLLSYNLWSLFIRFFNLSKHEEARNSRRDFLLLASQYIEKGRERILKMSAIDSVWERIRQGYNRLLAWIRSTAPQLRLGSFFGQFAIAFAKDLGPPGPKLLPVNCGI